MATTSTAAIAKAFRSRLLAFAPLGGGDTLQTRLGGQLFLDVAPETATGLHGVLSVDVLPGTLDGQVSVRGEAVLLLYNRPQSRREATSLAADVAAMALRKWIEPTGESGQGLIVVTGVASRVLPPPSAPADRDLVTARVTASFYAHPQYLTQYATPAA